MSDKKTYNALVSRTITTCAFVTVEAGEKDDVYSKAKEVAPGAAFPPYDPVTDTPRYSVVYWQEQNNPENWHFPKKNNPMLVDISPVLSAIKAEPTPEPMFSGADPDYGLIAYSTDGKPFFISPRMTNREAMKLLDRLKGMNVRVVSHEEAMAALKKAVRDC